MEKTLNRKSGASSVAGDVVSDLKRLGFTEYEARIYVQLLRNSPATAYEISKNAGVPRPNTYNALEALVQRGAVLPVSESPARYVASSPDELMGAISRQTAHLCTNLTSRLAVAAMRPDDQYVWSLTGEDAAHDKIDSVIRFSKVMLMIKAGDDILRRHKDALQEAADRGVEMLIVLFGFDAEEFQFGDKCRVYIHESNGVRMGSTDNLFTIASDHKEMVTARLDDDVMAVHTRNYPIVNMAESLIRHDYYMAEIFLQFGAEIEERFGPYLRDLRLACFNSEQVESFRQKTGLK